MPSRPPLLQRRSSSGVWPVDRGRSNAVAARYAAAGRDYAPSGAPFANVRDLGAVIGMTPELLTRLRPHLTVFTDSDPGATTRDPVVAQALAAVGQRDVNVDEIGAGLVSVTADARGGRARFALHVIVRINAQPRAAVMKYCRSNAWSRSTVSCLMDGSMPCHYRRWDNGRTRQRISPNQFNRLCCYYWS